MTAEFNDLKAKVEKLEQVAQSTADKLVAAQTDIKDLQMKLAQPNPDIAAMQDLAASVDQTLNNIATELPVPSINPVPSESLSEAL